MHARAKYVHRDHLPIVDNATAGARLQVSRDLRAIRAGTGFKSYASKSAVMEYAVKSTNLRNTNRLYAAAKAKRAAVSAKVHKWGPLGR